MRIRATIAAGVGAIVGATLLWPSEAHAQQTTLPFVERDKNWDLVSNVMMSLGVASVTLTPRVYYSSPDATVGWKARWHISSLAPVMSMVGLTLLVDGPFHDAIKGTRPECTVDETTVDLPGSGCESFGMPSTQSFAAWGAFGGGLGIFLVDTFKYSSGEFHGGSFVGDVAIPFGAALMTSVGRGLNGSGFGHESVEQIIGGAVPGLIIGGALGLAYSFLQEPNCGYGDTLFCW